MHYQHLMGCAINVNIIYDLQIIVFSHTYCELAELYLNFKYSTENSVLGVKSLKRS